MKNYILTMSWKLWVIGCFEGLAWFLCGGLSPLLELLSPPTLLLGPFPVLPPELLEPSFSQLSSHSAFITIPVATIIPALVTIAHLQAVRKTKTPQTGFGPAKHV
jgi:hypothetical protein